MSFSTLFHDVSGLFSRPSSSSETGQAHTLVEIADAAESDKLDKMLGEAGISPEKVSAATPVRRKWSELRAFDRSTFDYDAYMHSLED